MKLDLKQKFSYGVGAIGKDMVYALTASYVLYYYQDIIGLDPLFVGTILMVARIFDAANDPLTGIFVAKTKTKYGRFRPWLFCGTIINAFTLYALFAAPNYDPNSAAMMVYFSVAYIMWGTTYDFMDIPYWSMIPAVTDTPEDRETLTVVGRTCAGVGNAIMQMLTLIAVKSLGGGNDKLGFKYVALAVCVIFVLTETLCTFLIKERHDVESEKTVTIKEMFTALIKNDQAMVTALTIILINMALYLTSNFILYFFKYDFGGPTWEESYTLFSTVGGGFQIIGMMVLYPLLRKFKMTNEKVFRMSIFMALAGYALILLICFLGFSSNLIMLLIPAILVFSANGMLTILTTIFLSSSVDYGQIKTGHREESVIFSMQTFVVKAASGVSVFLTGLGIKVIGLVTDSADGIIAQQTPETLLGLRLAMTILPILGLFIALMFFNKKFKMTDAYAQEMAEKVKANG